MTKKVNINSLIPDLTYVAGQFNNPFVKQTECHEQFTFLTDIDGPTMCTSRDGDIVMVMRHFKSGRKIHAYETLNEGTLLYEINIDADSNIRYVKSGGRIRT